MLTGSLLYYISVFLMHASWIGPQIYWAFFCVCQPTLPTYSPLIYFTTCSQRTGDAYLSLCPEHPTPRADYMTSLWKQLCWYTPGSWWANQAQECLYMASLFPLTALMCAPDTYFCLCWPLSAHLILVQVIFFTRDTLNKSWSIIHSVM